MHVDEFQVTGWSGQHESLSKHHRNATQERTENRTAQRGGKDKGGRRRAVKQNTNHVKLGPIPYKNPKATY